MKTAQQAKAAIERFLEDADYTLKQLVQLLTSKYEGYTEAEVQAGWDLYVEEAFQALGDEEETTEDAEGSILDNIDWDL